METILKVGDRAKGFEFPDLTDGNHWGIGKAKYIGKIGVITWISKTYFSIDFNDGCGDWHYPISLMHLAVVEEQPQVIEIDMSKVEKCEYLMNGIWEVFFVTAEKYRFTMKDENKIKIEQEIEELEEKIKELKSKL